MNELAITQVENHNLLNLKRPGGKTTKEAGNLKEKYRNGENQRNPQTRMNPFQVLG